MFFPSVPEGSDAGSVSFFFPSTKLFRPEFPFHPRCLAQGQPGFLRTLIFPFVLFPRDFSFPCLSSWCWGTIISCRRPERRDLRKTTQGAPPFPTLPSKIHLLGSRRDPGATQPRHWTGAKFLLESPEPAMGSERSSNASGKSDFCGSSLAVRL